MKNTKGILVYLGVAFGVTFAIEGILRGLGLLPMVKQNLFQILTVCALFFVPALAAVIARRAEGSNTEDLPAVWPIPWPKAVRIAVVVLGIVFVQHVIVAVCGWHRPQWGMETAIAAIQALGFQAPPVVMALVPVLAYTFGTVLPLALGLTLYAAFAFGGEYGWRGYLLPRLEGLGTFRAYVATGLLWAGWWLPLVYFSRVDGGSAESFAQFLPRFILVMILLGAVSGRILRRTGHVGLCAIFIGSVCSQWEGLWPYLFQLPVYPWAGSFGVVAAAVWLVAAFVPGLFTSSPAAATQEER